MTKNAAPQVLEGVERRRRELAELAEAEAAEAAAAAAFNAKKHGEAREAELRQKLGY